MWQLIVRWWRGFETRVRSRKVGRPFLWLLGVAVLMFCLSGTSRDFGGLIGLFVGMATAYEFMVLPGEKPVKWRVIPSSASERAWFIFLFGLSGRLGGEVLQDLLVPILRGFGQ